MRREMQPPAMEFFARHRPEAGPHAVSLTLGRLEIELGGLDSGLADKLCRRFAPYTGASSGGPDALRIRLGLEEADYFIDPPSGPDSTRVLIACDGERVRYASYRAAGWFDSRGPAGELLLARGDFEPVERSLENFFRCAVAWLAACRGGALVHAASAVWNGKGYLFYGESGAGKSTLSAANRRGLVVSDDLSLVVPDEQGRLELVGSPFRGTYEEGPPVMGRFPLKAGFRLIQAPRAEVREVSRVRALSELIGNLPFVAESFSSRPDLFERVQNALGALPLAHLHFRRDDTYWDAIAAAGY